MEQEQEEHTTTTTTTTTTSKNVSKNQIKKQIKRQLMLEERPARRAAERERKKLKKAELKKQKQKNNQQQPTQSSAEEQQDRKSTVIFPSVVALDCRFDDKMSEKEIISLDRQIAHSYSINRKANVQFESLLCTSFNGRLSERFVKNDSQYLKWKSVQFTSQSLDDIVSRRNTGVESTGETLIDEGNIENQIIATSSSSSSSSSSQDKEKMEIAINQDGHHPREEDTPQDPPKVETDHTTNPSIDPCHPKLDHPVLREELLDKQNVIYLTADSENVLTCIEPNKVYVIGALVDRNRYKNLCLDLAVQHNFQHAQLPINQYFSQLKTRKVLTVNQVLEILISYLDNQDWEKAFERVIPSRKL
ncbi:hypothetical protein PCANC_07007 [Puccinia coronata f. sp. avenae]|uniref:tRNA (guanine(9)-N1)-methyltransferase n=1 Tax=Puccinia coronata f. sp. avenae TaxID=200324 RepID=A0A2N5UZW2_9BASI|nr:hypothetical protein PCANC_07007 [Puccinia coronata f. sp. avenae]